MIIELANKKSLVVKSITRQYSNFTKNFSLSISFDSEAKLEELLEILTPEACAIINIPENGRTFEGYTVLSTMQERFGDEPTSIFVSLDQA